MILLPPLKKGDKIGVWTPSDPVVGTVAEGWIQRGREYLERQGFVLKMGKTLKAHTAYTAGTVKCRVKDFLTFVEDPNIKMIITALGGENAHQILPFIDFDKVASHPKIIMGYSDPTVFLNPIARFSGIPTFYGFHLASFDPRWPYFSDYDKNCFQKIFLNRMDVPFEIPPSGVRECWRKGKTHGSHLIGGCLNDLVKLLATPYEPQWEGGTLILESANTPPQNIDVYFTHLRQAKVFDRIAGLILGTFHNFKTSSPDRYKPLRDVVMTCLKGFDFPVLKTQDFGHFSHFCPLPLGAQCQMDAEKKTFQITQPLFEQ